jgi:dihydrofolate synthase/folylpolyglutamate synthase
MNYDEAKDYIQHLNMFGMKLGLDRIEHLLSLLNNPESEFCSIIVGGTSGKGSTCVMLGSILKEAGFKVGVFTKPHLFDFRERISVNGEMISDKDFIRLTEKIKPLAEKTAKEIESPTFFEFVTSMAFEYFREKGVDFVVLEVGLGGRLDATNVTNPEVSIITNVSLEHTDILGKTIEKITKEKAGIVKKNGILVTGSENPKVLKFLKKVCKERKARLLKAKKLKNAKSSSKDNTFDFENSRISVPLAGKFQLQNIGCVLKAIRNLGKEIPLKAIKEGLKKVEWPGRFEMMEKNPLVLLDGAKNAESLKSVSESLDLLNYERLYTILGVSNDKLIPEMVKEISKKTDFFILTKHKVMGRGAEIEALRKEVEKHNKPFLIFGDVKYAVEKAKELANKKDLILVTGSLFTVAEARELWFPQKPKMGREFNENFRAQPKQIGSFNSMRKKL